MKKKINYFLQAVIIYFLFFVGRLLGLNLSRKLFALLFSSVGPYIKSKKIIYRNLNIYNENLSSSDEKKIIKNMWKNYGKTFIEYVYLNKLRKNNSQINLIGEKNLLQVLQNQKPVIFISGHFANFELMSMEITKHNVSLATIYRPLNNIFLNPLMEYLRRKYVCKNQIKKGISGVKQAMEYINKNYSIALMIDQRVGESERFDLFGKQAHTTTLPAQLSIKFNLDIVPVFIKREYDDQFTIEFKERIDPNIYNNKKEITERLNRILEQMIKDNPSQWIWTHDRWK